MLEVMRTPAHANPTMMKRRGAAERGRQRGGRGRRANAGQSDERRPSRDESSSPEIVSILAIAAVETRHEARVRRRARRCRGSPPTALRHGPRRRCSRIPEAAPCWSTASESPSSSVRSRGPRPSAPRRPHRRPGGREPELPGLRFDRPPHHGRRLGNGWQRGRLQLRRRRLRQHRGRRVDGRLRGRHQRVPLLREARSLNRAREEVGSSTPAS